MNLFEKLMMSVITIASSLQMQAQIKNAQTITAKISGNCGMCKAIIENAGTIKKEAQVQWNESLQIATITYDSKKTNSDQVLKRIALAGYDNEKYLAPDRIYKNLHGCCQYERKANANFTESQTLFSEKNNYYNIIYHENTFSQDKQFDQITIFFARYFDLHESLVKSNSKMAATAADNLQKVITSIDMTKFKTDEHKVWMQFSGKLFSNLRAIASTLDIKKQRALFAKLSENIFILARATEHTKPIYYINCPMYNGYWLSSDKTIENPYYGSQMLSCGKIIETIQ